MEPDSQDNLVNQFFMVDVTQFWKKLEIRAYNARLLALTSLIETIQTGRESDLTKKAATALVQSILDQTIARGLQVYPDTQLPADNPFTALVQSILDQTIARGPPEYPDTQLPADNPFTFLDCRWVTSTNL